MSSISWKSLAEVGTDQLLANSMSFNVVAAWTTFMNYIHIRLSKHTSIIIVKNLQPERLHEAYIILRNRLKKTHTTTLLPSPKPQAITPDSWIPSWHRPRWHCRRTRTKPSGSRRPSARPWRSCRPLWWGPKQAEPQNETPQSAKEYKNLPSHEFSNAPSHQILDVQVHPLVSAVGRLPLRHLLLKGHHGKHNMQKKHPKKNIEGPQDSVVKPEKDQTPDCLKGFWRFLKVFWRVWMTKRSYVFAWKDLMKRDK